ncbi:MAG: hypothetical protein ABW082_14305 [Sedimenticola sp.]
MNLIPHILIIFTVLIGMPIYADQKIFSCSDDNTKKVSLTCINIKILENDEWTVYTAKGVAPKIKGSSVTRPEHLDPREIQKLSNQLTIIRQLTDGFVGNDELRVFSSNPDGNVGVNIISGDSSIGYDLRGTKTYFAVKQVDDVESFINLQ